MQQNTEVAAGELPSYAAFLDARGEVFTLGENALEARLASVSRCRRESGWESFSLIFELSAAEPVPQATYRLAHARLGTISLLLVPVGPAPDRPDHLCYEAAFNRRAAT